MKPSLFTYSHILLMILLVTGCGPKSAYQTPPPPKVTAVKPKVETIPMYLIENGETEAVEEAVVEARVRGILGKPNFDPDSIVKKGQKLFSIEKEEYLAAVQSEKAAVSSAKAALSAADAAVEVAAARIVAVDAEILLADTSYQRLKKLVLNNAVSQSEYDIAEAELATAKAKKTGDLAAKTAAEANVENAQANVEKAEANLVQANLELKWTDVMAPIAGRVTRTLVKEGNMVEPGTALIEIVKNDPIWANFNISERFLLDVERQAGRKDDETIDPTNLKVRLQRSGDTPFPFEGHLDYFDPRIDQDTGTLQLRAVFDNKPGQGNTLLPGMFVRVRVEISQIENALLVPERAVSRDQAGTFVYVIGGDNKADRKNVKLGTKHNDLIVVESGINPGESVIVDGIQRVRPGVVVDPR